MATLLKDIYNDAFFKGLTTALAATFPGFSKPSFIKSALDEQWPQRELKQRMKHLAVVLHSLMNGDFEKDSQTLVHLIGNLRSIPVREQVLEYMFLPEYIAMYGINDFQNAMKAIEFTTQFISCEFAIRPFLLKYPNETMVCMQQWSLHKNYHVRRFSSEGSRPRLPWGAAIPSLKKDPAPVLPILENLKNDSSEYVRKSVANNLNDISRDHPALVISIAEKWKGISKETDWIIKHGCRTLLRKADKGTLALWGLSPASKVKINDLVVERDTIRLGDYLQFSFTLVSSEPLPVKLRIEYKIDYVKVSAKGGRKLFKITENEYAPNKVYPFKRRQSFHDMTTRKHHPGKHQLSVIVNGTELASVTFMVTI